MVGRRTGPKHWEAGWRHPDLAAALLRMGESINPPIPQSPNRAIAQSRNPMPNAPIANHPMNRSIGNHQSSMDLPFANLLP